MKQLNEFLNNDALKRLAEQKPLTKRQWIYSFMNRLDEGRYPQDYLTPARMGKTLSKWEYWELPRLWKECDTSNNFIIKFWWFAGMREYQKKPKPPKQRKLL